MNQNPFSVLESSRAFVETNRVLRNTYALLSLTLLFSAGTAALAMLHKATPMHPFLALIGMMGLMFLTQALRNSVWGLVSIFAFTGFMGYTLGPILNFYLTHFVNGSQLIMTAFGATGVIFLALSAYAMTTRKDFSYLAGFLFVAAIVGLLAAVASIFLPIPGLFLAISCLFVLISSGMILFQTSLIINGGEQNYIMATISLYVSLYNLFVSLLQIFGFFSNRE